MDGADGWQQMSGLSKRFANILFAIGIPSELFVMLAIQKQSGGIMIEDAASFMGPDRECTVASLVRSFLLGL